jgi:phosphate transport system protein
MDPSQFDQGSAAPISGAERATATSHSLREQDALWREFLGLASSVVEALEKSVLAVCDGRFDLIADLEKEEDLADCQEVQIEVECLRILARYEPVASDLRRMATVLKVNRDWERIADLALRVARRARKLSRLPDTLSMPEPLKKLARDVLAQVRSCLGALAAVDGEAARRVIAGDHAIDEQYRTLRSEFKAALSLHPEQLDAWLLLINTARNLERIADHASGIAQTVVYLHEGVIIRHSPQGPSSDA